MLQPQNGDRFDAPNYVIIITDGNSNINPEETVPEANRDKNLGEQIKVFKRFSKKEYLMLTGDLNAVLEWFGTVEKFVTVTLYIFSILQECTSL